MGFIIREFTPDDAARVARMWNESNEGWPGGFSGGVPFTAESVMEHFGKSQFVAQLLAIEEDRAIGYCSVSACPGQTENVYIPLLNCVPDCHGRGVGKALLLEAVKRATEARYRCLDLHTWAGNMKAVPLYKKTGFFWQPETSVHMENFLPQILPHPLMQEFLRGRDWYSLFRRELEVHEDKVEWNGIKVYPYEFESEQGRIRFVADRSSNGITAIETPEFEVACIVGREDFPAGIEHPIRWEIRNRGVAGALSVSLFAEGEPGISLNVQEGFEVRDELVIERSFRSDTNAVKRWDADRPSHVVRSTLVVNGKAIALHSGIGLRDPIQMPYFRRLPKLRPGVPITTEAFLRSQMDTDVDAEVLLGPASGLKVEPIEGSDKVQIPARNWSGGRYQILPEKAGGFEIPIRIRFAHDGKIVESCPAPIPVVVTEPGRPEGIITDTAATMDNEYVRIHVPIKGSGLSFQRPDEGFYAWFGKGCIGMPFDGRDFERTRFQMRFERNGDSLTLCYSAPSNSFPGLILEGRVTMNATPLVEIRYRLLNRSASSRQVQFKTGGNVSEHINKNIPIEWVTVPLKEGILRERVNQDPIFPGRDDLPRDPKEYSESWSCYEGPGCAVGLLWGDAEKLEFDWRGLPGVTIPPFEVPAGGSVDLSPIRVYAGPGNWQTVRDIWAAQTGTHLPETIRTISMVDFRTEPSPLFITSAQTNAEVRAESRRGREMPGTLKLELPEELHANGTEFAIETLKRGQEFSHPIELKTEDLSPRVVEGKLTHVGEFEDRSAKAPIIVLGDSKLGLEIEETGDGDFALHTGWMTARISAKHSGTLYALERGGQNHLFTSYPTPKEFIWFNPWFGGMHMHVQGPANMLPSSPKRWEKIERTGSKGLNWQGARVIFDIEHKDYRYYRFETDYLTLPGSNLVAIISRMVNRTGAFVRTGFGSTAFTNPGGERLRTTGWFCQNGEMRAWRHCDSMKGISSEGWIANSTPDGGACVSLLRGPGMDHVFLWDMGREGMALEAQTSVLLDAYASSEAITYLALTDTVEAAFPYRALCDLTELP